MGKAEEFMRLGTQAEENGDIKEAIKYYQSAAEAGSTDGLASIGLLYQYGTGVDESIDIALKWFQKVIDAGDFDGYWLKGNAYKEIGDYENAVICYEKAAENGGNCKFFAVYDLAQAYHYGEGKGKNFAIALELYHKSAENGEAVAMLTLGDLFRQGEIVCQDNECAIYWYGKAKEAGSNEAKERLMEMKRN